MAGEFLKEYYEKSGDETPTIKVERKKVELPIDEIIHTTKKKLKQVIIITMVLLIIMK